MIYSKHAKEKDKNPPHFIQLVLQKHEKNNKKS
jgi:hypothetical protein